MYPANRLKVECYILSLTSTAGRTSRVLFADVIPWINKASLALSNTKIRVVCPSVCLSVTEGHRKWP